MGKEGSPDAPVERSSPRFSHTCGVALSGAKIAAWFADWSGRRLLEEEIFGTGDPEHIAAIVDRFCGRSLGSRIKRYEFFASSVLSVYGVRLSDGRHVVIKAARRSFGAALLGAALTVQSHLAASGFPCPSPLLGPAALERGICVVEEHLSTTAPPPMPTTHTFSEKWRPRSQTDRAFETLRVTRCTGSELARFTWRWRAVASAWRARVEGSRWDGTPAAVRMHSRASSIAMPTTTDFSPKALDAVRGTGLR